MNDGRSTGRPATFGDYRMVELIAKNTIQRVLDGKFITHAPGTRFEMLDDDAHALVRMRAAVLVNQNEAQTGPDVYAIQAPVVVQQSQAPQEAVQADETAVIDAEITVKPETATAAPARKGKTSTE